MSEKHKEMWTIIDLYLIYCVIINALKKFVVLKYQFEAHKSSISPIYLNKKTG